MTYAVAENCIRRKGGPPDADGWKDKPGEETLLSPESGAQPDPKMDR